MKKYLLTLVLALLLAAFASASAAQEYYTLPEIREQAAQGWHQTYTDKYDRTRQVDVDIEVFGAETAPVLKACWGTKHIEWHGPLGDPGVPIVEADLKGKGTKTYLYEDIPYMKVNLDQKYAEGYGNDLTLREVYDFFNERLMEQGRNLYQDYFWERPYRFGVKYCADKKTGDVLIPAMYSITFCQKEFGLPILTDAGTSFQQLQVPFTCPGSLFNMRDRETYSGTNSNFKITEILAEDIPLCSIDTIIEGARGMIESGYIHDVLSLRFGYVVYGDPDLDWKKRLPCNEIDTWYLIPSWVMGCYILQDAKIDELSEYPGVSEITINAQTGEMLDYFDTSLNGGGDVRYKGFIPWDNVK